MPTTKGIDLRIERTRARATIIAVALQMGLSRQTLWTLERSEKVDPERAREYRAALRAIVDAREAS